MKLSFNEQFIGIQHYESFSCYHISQFFNDDEPKPYWTITSKQRQNLLKWDWNKDSLFLLYDTKNESGDHVRFLKHYSLNTESLKTQPLLIGTVPNTQNMITDIHLFDSLSIFAIAVKKGFVVFYQYSVQSNIGSYKVIHLLNISQAHPQQTQSKSIPFLITWMKESGQICINYGISRR